MRVPRHVKRRHGAIELGEGLDEHWRVDLVEYFLNDTCVRFFHKTGANAEVELALAEDSFADVFLDEQHKVIHSLWCLQQRADNSGCNTGITCEAREGCHGCQIPHRQMLQMFVP